MNQQTLWQNGLEADRMGQQKALAEWISKKYWQVTSKRFSRMDLKQADWVSKTQ